MKRNTILIVLFSILTVLLLAYFYFGSERKKSFSWKESYSTNSDQPYGTQFIRKLLENYRDGEKFIYNDKTPLATLLDDDSANVTTDYVFIGNQLSLSDEDASALLHFIRSGNDAFISTPLLPYQLVDLIFYQECDNELFLQEHMMSAATFNFYHPSLRTTRGYTYQYKPGSQVREYKWTALQPDLFCDSMRSVVALGHFENDAVNFFKLPYGDGNLYVHTNPIAFTNYFMRIPENAEYTGKVFSHLKGRTIVWDEYSKAPFNGQENESNPLALIMKHDSLKYAWWLMLVSAILYTVFTAKRKQRVVPVISEKVNTSLEYVKMVSALHFENANHKDMALKKMKYFIYFIRAKYGIYSPQLTQEHFKRLAEKSKIEQSFIESIFDQHEKIEKNPYSSAGAHQLMDLYNAIDHFYKHCK